MSTWVSGLARVFSVAASVILGACGIDVFSGPSADRSLPESHGRAIVSAAPDNVRWSADGRVVTFVSSDRLAAHALDVSTGLTGLLYQVTSQVNVPPRQIHDVQFTVDGEEFFTLIQGTSVRVQRHQASGQVLQSYAAGASFNGTAALLVAPSQPATAFLDDSGRLYLLRRGAEPALWGEGCWGILTFSPDESRVVCATDALAGSLRIFQAGPIEQLGLPAGALHVPASVRWDEAGIRILFWTRVYPYQLRLYQPSTGSITTIATLGPSESWGPAASWARNGNRVAYWTAYCTEPLLGGCNKSQAVLYLLDVGPGTVKRVAVHSSKAGAVAISPDGTTVAYVAGGRLYLLAVP